jgi:hypothetical protein
MVSLTLRRALNARTFTFDSDHPVSSATSLIEASSPSIIVKANLSSADNTLSTRSARSAAIKSCSTDLCFSVATLMSFSSNQSFSFSVKSDTVNSGRRFAPRNMFKHVLVAIRVNHPSIEPRPSYESNCVKAFRKTSCAASSTNVRCRKKRLATLKTRGLYRLTISVKADSSPARACCARSRSEACS